MDCFGTYFTHVQSCNVTRVQSATEWTASPVFVGIVTNVIIFDVVVFVFHLRQDPQMGSSSWTLSFFTLGCM